MSYDVSIGSFDGNYTYNLGRLFHNHIRSDGGTGLRCLHGMTGKQAHAILSAAFDSIHKEYLDAWKSHEVGARTFCAEYDPANGWGSTVGAMIFLAQVSSACAQHPRRKVRVS